MLLDKPQEGCCGCLPLRGAGLADPTARPELHGGPRVAATKPLPLLRMPNVDLSGNVALCKREQWLAAQRFSSCLLAYTVGEPQTATARGPQIHADARA